jgi:hypothetical protein
MILHVLESKSKLELYLKYHHQKQNQCQNTQNGKMLKLFLNQHHELKNDENRKFQTTMSTFFF